MTRASSPPFPHRILELRVLSLPWRPVAVAGLMLFVVGCPSDLCNAAPVVGDTQTEAATPGEQKATPARTVDPLHNWPPKTIEPTAVPPTSVPTPASDTPAVPVAQVTAAAAVMVTCKQRVATLTSGDPSAFAPLKAETRDALMQETAAVRAFTCLAIANDNGRYCDALPARQKDDCTSRWQFVRDLKSSKGSVKAQLLYRMCLGQDSPAQCEKLRDAIATHTAGMCTGVDKPTTSAFCAAIASGDATKCEVLSEPSDRDQCAALATDDESRCPKEWADCVNLVRGFAKAKHEGLQGLEQTDPEFGAAVKGKSACTPFLAVLEALCGRIQLGTAAPPPFTPRPTAPH